MSHERILWIGAGAEVAVKKLFPCLDDPACIFVFPIQAVLRLVPPFVRGEHRPKPMLAGFNDLKRFLPVNHRKEQLLFALEVCKAIRVAATLSLKAQ